MAQVSPFHGVRYRLESAAAAGEVVCPPYDVISPAQAEALRTRDPHNVVQLELPESRPGDTGQDNRYTRASGLYRRWREAGVLAADAAPHLYVYGQRYRAEGQAQERLGLLGALRVEPYEAGVVLPHEQTFPKHKEDRYRLLTTAGVQFSPIFGLYSAPQAGVRARLDAVAAAGPAALAVDTEGVEHRLWPVSDPHFHAWAAGVFAGQPVFIADGHHRYETALRLATERRAAGRSAGAAECVMTFLVEMDDPGLVLLPTHRLVRSLPGPIDWERVAIRFEVQEVPPAAAGELAHHQIGVVLPGGAARRLTLRDPRALDALDQEHSAAWRDLDVAILHRLLLQELLGSGPESEIDYTRDTAEALALAAGCPLGVEFAAGFLLPPPRVEELKAVAGAGDRMPQKSTYFWPKALTGLVLYDLS